MIVYLSSYLSLLDNLLLVNWFLTQELGSINRTHESTQKFLADYNVWGIRAYTSDYK
jgi:hypothetical protein